MSQMAVFLGVAPPLPAPRLRQILARRGLTQIRIAKKIIIVDSGREKNIRKSPWEMVSERRSDVSAIGPSMKPRMKGAI